LRQFHTTISRLPNEAKGFLILWSLLWITAAQGQITIAPNSWGLGTPMPTARTGVFSAAIGNKIYVVGGQTNGAPFTVNEIYDTTTNLWSTGAALPTARELGAAAVVNNILYVIGGGTGSTGVTPSNVVEAYDPSTDKWATKAPMPVAIDSVYAAVDNNIIYVVGGFNPGSGRLSNVLAYNPATDKWSIAAPLLTGKSCSAVGVVGSLLVSAGGLSNSNVIADTEGYNPLTNAWTALSPEPAARQAGCFGSIGGVLYSTAGNPVGNAGPQLATMDAYNASNNSWASNYPLMPDAVLAPGSATVNGRLYCFGGTNNSSQFQNQGSIRNSVQIYQPPPAISLGGVVPVFSSATTIQPGSWVSIFGTNLAQSTTVWNGDFPTNLGGATVTINNKPAYIWYTSPGQINVQAPDDTTVGPVPVVVNVVGSTSSTTVTLGSYAPSFSLLNAKYPAALVVTTGAGNSGGGYDLIGPAGAFSFATRPVKAGETLILYGVGFGPTTSPVLAGHVFSGAATVPVLPQVTIGGVPVNVTFTGIIEAGLYQLNVVVPSAPSGDQPLQAKIGGVTTPSNVVLTIQ
jgi:uncharacterized protein (TIGR03437 family)